jgi:hypothetical protein
VLCSSSCLCCEDWRWRPKDALLLQDTWHRSQVKSERVGVFARFALPPAAGAPGRLGEAEGLLTDMGKEMMWDHVSGRGETDNADGVEVQECPKGRPPRRRRRRKGEVRGPALRQSREKSALCSELS